MESFLTEGRGWGIKAAEAIQKGTFIVEYAGGEICAASAVLSVQEGRQAPRLFPFTQDCSP